MGPDDECRHGYLLGKNICPTCTYEGLLASCKHEREDPRQPCPGCASEAKALVHARGQGDYALDREAEGSGQQKLDLVNHPPHYSSGGIESIDVIEAFNLKYHAGSAVKYILRHGLKDNALMDLQKARWYIDREISRLEGDTDNDPENP